MSALQQTARKRIFFLLILISVLASGCATVHPYGEQVRSVYTPYSQGEVSTAASRVTDENYRGNRRSNEALLWQLEAGKILYAAGRHEESLKSFERAEEIILDFETRPSVNIRSGLSNLGVLVTNPAAMPYRGNYAEKIMVNTYKAMNYIALGDLEAARVEIRRSYERQQQAIEENEKAIEAARREAAAHSLSPRQTYQNSTFREAYGEVDRQLSPAYADFANPLTTFLSALVYLADNDRGSAEVDLRLLSELPLDNSFVEDEYRRLQAFFDGNPPGGQSRVYVIFESGLGPDLEEMRVDLLLPEIGYTGFTFPRVVFKPTPVGGLAIRSSAGETPVHTEHLASMDQIVATEFNTRVPAMVTRTVASVASKELLAHQLKDELGPIGLILGSIYKAVVNRADTRAWKTLGKEFHIAAFDYPTEGKISLSLVDRNKNELHTRQEVQLPEGDFIVVLAHSINRNDLRASAAALR